MHNTHKIYIHSLNSFSCTYFKLCRRDEREGGELLSGNLVSWPVAPLKATQCNWQLGHRRAPHISPSCLHFLKICLCRDFQSFEKSQFLLVEWRKWWLPHQTHISTVFNFCRFLLGRLSVFLKISLCGIVGWGVGGGLGSVALLDSHLQALFTFGRCSRCYRIVPWQKSSQWNWLRGNYVDYWGQQQTVNPTEGWA